MDIDESTKVVEETIRDLFRMQKLAVLSTHNAGQPYASLVAFAATEDLRHLYFATARTTRKYRNLSLDPRVAMLMDSRSNLDSDVHTAVAVTATGTAAEVSGQERDQSAQRYLARHRYLQDFIGAETCAFVRVTVKTYYLVSRFQQVMELHLLP
jgi:nitroimidazol reductase NimA-like FMN-containing flavoprotein (pyridoxamine 5'-phosphate oxidase superfamily)